MARRLKQLELPPAFAWGGARPGAGRRLAATRPSPSHRLRGDHDPKHPVHVTLRAGVELPSLRSTPIFASLNRALAAATRGHFRVIHFSVQTDHLHLIVEGDTPLDLTRGIQGLAIRCARAINRASGRRGSVWSSRYHAHTLRTPSEVRRAIAYVLLNFRKHLRAIAGLDPRSSAAWFDGWTVLPEPVLDSSPVAKPRTWLASIGWRRAGGPINH